jgi:hypothetical protein
MEHKTALKTLAAERYLLGEMTGEERDDFEAHYFTCTECAEEVRHAAALAENLKAVGPEGFLVTEEKPGILEQIAGWFAPARWVPSAAAACLAVVSGYQQFVVIPGLRAPSAITAAVLAPATRGEPRTVSPGRDGFVSMLLELNAPAAVKNLRIEIYSDSKALVRSIEADNGPNVLVRVNSRDLPAGRYELRIVTPGGDILDRYPVQVTD